MKENQHKEKNEKIKPVNIKLLSLFAGGASSAYQYYLLQNNPKMPQVMKLGICAGSFVFCYGVTNFFLKNVNKV